MKTYYFLIILTISQHSICAFAKHDQQAQLRHACIIEAKAQGITGDYLMLYSNSCVEKRAGKENGKSGEYGQARPASDAELTGIREAMQLKMKDVESAKFANMTVRERLDDAGQSMFCGLINGKNSYGAYSGFTALHGARIHINGKQKDIIMILSDDDGMARTLCMQLAMILP